jgi:hypothetical protein
MNSDELAEIRRHIESASRFSTDDTVRIRIVELRRLLAEVERVRKVVAPADTQSAVNAVAEDQDCGGCRAGAAAETEVTALSG